MNINRQNKGITLVALVIVLFYFAPIVKEIGVTYKGRRTCI